ncbi:alpha/beta fold hydrolase [Streptomyces sp. NPDC046324]|uniref:alpha/beta fold hydrolase n=1 Tax=Streptomyces sp. NPDC046324 TaxID=3154915 RepID=UPI0033EC45BE
MSGFALDFAWISHVGCGGLGRRPVPGRRDADEVSSGGAVNWTLGEEFETPGGMVRWRVLGSGEPVVLVHGTPYSSFLRRDIAPALARNRTVFVFDHLGFGQSGTGVSGQDLSLRAHARNLARLLDHWGLDSPSVVAHDIGGAVGTPNAAAGGAELPGPDPLRRGERR